MQAREELIARDKAALQVSGSKHDHSDAAHHQVHQFRTDVLQSAISEPGHPATQSFLDLRTEIQSTDLFRVLRRMPKGAALHVHSSTAGDVDWLLDWMQRQENCYIFTAESSEGHHFGDIHYFTPGEPRSGFSSAAQALSAASDIRSRIAALYRFDPNSKMPPWQQFNLINGRIGALLNYHPLFVDYFDNVFRTLAQDNVTHLELRTGIGQLWDLNGRKWSDAEFVQEYELIAERLRQDYPDFRLQLIMATGRGGPPANQGQFLERALTLRQRFPDTVIGFDLVGCEQDSGVDNITQELQLWLKLPTLHASYGTELKLFLHDGESNSAQDTNLFDAYLLNSQRIGHGTNLDKFPKLEKEFARRRTPFEICPISNQALGYVGDLRLHPAAGFMRRGVTCVLSSDDPFIFGNNGLSYDFWVAVVAWELHLQEVRLLCRNSIEFSSLPVLEREAALLQWEADWADFEAWLAAGAKE